LELTTFCVCRPDRRAAAGPSPEEATASTLGPTGGARSPIRCAAAVPAPAGPIA